ncbi:MAG TPA: S1C family serine protease [Candidatus Binataceae bacterium]|nr:S1C family serine protease [Candidatus Binataceae bacterium]
MNASLPLLERVSNATVGIHSQVPATHPSAAVGLGTERRTGGVLVDPAGLVLTVNYALMGAQSLIVTLANGEQRQGWVVAQDYTSGMGLVRLDGKGPYPHLSLTPSINATLGEDVFVVSSVGNEERRADSGLITYLGPFDAVWEYQLERCIMASAMNFGVGGGPLCNSKAEMLGLSYLSMAEIGRSVLAIPSEYYLTARDDLVSHGRRTSVKARPWLGLLSYTLREHVVIAGVMPGGPGEKAGLKPGDVVLEIDGRSVTERKGFYSALWSHGPGDTFSLKIFRNNLVQEIDVTGIAVEDYYG